MKNARICTTEFQRKDAQIPSSSESWIRVLRALISLNGPDQPHLEPPPHPWAQELYLSSALSPQFLLELYWRSADLLHSHSLAMAPVDPLPIGWFPSLISVLPHFYESASQLLALILAYGLTSWPDLGPASSPRYCLMV